MRDTKQHLEKFCLLSGHEPRTTFVMKYSHVQAFESEEKVNYQKYVRNKDGKLFVYFLLWPSSKVWEALYIYLPVQPDT